MKYGTLWIGLATAVVLVLTPPAGPTLLPAQTGLTFDTLLEAEQSVELTARASGIVRRLLVKEGQTVAAGDTLLVLDGDDARAQVTQARARLELAEQTWQWDRQLHETDAISERQFLESRTRRVEAQAALQLAESALSRTCVLAPFPGVIVEADPPVQIGALVPVNTGVFTLVQADRLKATLYVPEQQIQRVAEGVEVRVVSRHDEALTAVGTVVGRSPVIDPASGTMKVEVALRRVPRGFIPGMQVRVTLHE